MWGLFLSLKSLDRPATNCISARLGHPISSTYPAPARALSNIWVRFVKFPAMKKGFNSRRLSEWFNAMPAVVPVRLFYARLHCRGNLGDCLSNMVMNFSVFQMDDACYFIIKLSIYIINENCC